MKKIANMFLVALVVLLMTGCYNDFENPAEGKIFADEDFTAEGLEYISIKQLKADFWRTTSAGTGAVASWEITKPLYTRGKVISSDRYGSIYKSVYLYDAETESAIELKLNSGTYVFYGAGRELFVKLEGLVLGNYRGMVSIGTKSGNLEYSNDNLELPVMIADHVFRGRNLGMEQSDTLVVDASNYMALTEDALGRLVRFENIESKFGTAPWGYNNSFPNYFANQTSYDVNSTETLNGVSFQEMIQGTPTWAAKGKLGDDKKDTYFYGSAWFTYDATDPGENTNAAPGNYVVRTSGYARFIDEAIPADGTKVDLTAILVKYTNSSGRYVTYQLTLNDGADVVVK